MYHHSFKIKLNSLQPLHIYKEQLFYSNTSLNIGTVKFTLQPLNLKQIKLILSDQWKYVSSTYSLTYCYD